MCIYIFLEQHIFFHLDKKASFLYYNEDLNSAWSIQASCSLGIAEVSTAITCPLNDYLPLLSGKYQIIYQ